MTDTLINILQWLIPSGGLGAVIVWLTNKTLRNVRTAKEVHDTYKALYDDLRQTLIQLQDENKKLYKVVSRLERAVSKAPRCRYYDTCPIRDELRDNPEISGKPKGGKRQRSDKRNTDSENYSGSGVESGNGDSPGEPP